MTDQDDRLAALFRAAAGDAPPGFDHDTVVTRSRQVTARRRTAVLGSAAALVVVLGTGVVIGAQAQQDPATSAAAPPPASAPRGNPDAEVMPYLAPEGAAPALAAPLGPGTTPCVDRQDPALRALLDGVLPQVAGAPEAAVTEECRPGGAREVNLEVTDGTAAGRLTVVSLPPGESPLQPQEAAAATAPTASGGTVVVRAAGDGPGALVPFADQLEEVASALAPGL